jgi:hypothetical protein
MLILKVYTAAGTFNLVANIVSALLYTGPWCQLTMKLFASEASVRDFNCKAIEYHSLRAS